MDNKYIIQQFNQFIESIDRNIIESINSNDNKLTSNISSIQIDLLNYYKNIAGTAAGFYGISEYIVFSTFKNAIENFNKPLKFEIRPRGDLCFFELKNHDKILTILHSSSLKHLNESNLFYDDFKFRAPDITILKKENGTYKLYNSRC